MPNNSNTVVTTVPSSTKKRSRITVGPVDLMSSAQHGRLVPNFIKPIFPGDTFTMEDFAGFAYADKSEKLPLSDILYDQFFFFVPFRLIDRRNWEKVLGYRENPLDKKVYGIPQISLNLNFEDVLDSIADPSDINKAMISWLPQYFHNCCVNDYDDQIISGSAYPLMAYWLLWNEYFRSEQLDNAIDIDTALANLEDFDINGNVFDGNNLEDIMSNLEYYHLIPERVNKLPDILTRGMISPQRSPDGQPVTLSLAGMAPLVVDQLHEIGGNLVVSGSDAGSTTKTGSIAIDNNNILRAYSSSLAQDVLVNSINLAADMSSISAVDINQLRLAFAIQSLYETKGKFGTRYISYLRGVWGIIVPDSALDRPEYLGGCRLAFNNMPVLDTANNLGLFAGYSATLFNGAQFDKTFLEYGFVIGLHCERVRHIYPQGCDLDVWDKKVELDIYNPKFAELGYMGQKKALVYNGDNSVFNYNEAWPLERSQLSRANGIFGTLGGDLFQEFRQKWMYADFYDEAPTFNSEWLKEPTENVARTMTGQLIPGANNSLWGHQYMFNFKFRYTLTRIIPVYSEPATL